jgi:hypothetical protein
MVQSYRFRPDTPVIIRPKQQNQCFCDLHNVKFLGDCPRYKYWRLLKSGGNGWAVEPEPVGSEALPPHLPGRSCYVTSYDWCIKEQLITLAEHGLTAKIMDETQPQFDISEW